MESNGIGNPCILISIWLAFSNKQDSHYEVGYTRAPVVFVYDNVGSDATDPRKAHQTTIFGCKGFRITPSNLSESVCLLIQLLIHNSFEQALLGQSVSHEVESIYLCAII